MKTIQVIQIEFLLCFVGHVSCWQFYTSLVDYTLVGTPPDPSSVHSEYRFGNCKNIKTLKLYAHIHMDALDVVGKIIIRGWLDLYRIPTCMILKAIAYEEYSLRSTSYNFQICVPRITYCHTHHRYKYYYYEWYIPSDLNGGMDWEIYFYGPENAAW